MTILTTNGFNLKPEFFGMSTTKTPTAEVIPSQPVHIARLAATALGFSKEVVEGTGPQSLDDCLAGGERWGANVGDAMKDGGDMSKINLSCDLGTPRRRKTLPTTSEASAEFDFNSSRAARLPVILVSHVKQCS